MRLAGNRGGEIIATCAALEEAIEQGAPIPDVVLLDVAGMITECASQDSQSSNTGGDADALAGAVRIGSRCACSELLQAWIASARLPEARLLLVTDRAVARDGG